MAVPVTVSVFGPSGRPARWPRSPAGRSGADGNSRYSDSTAHTSPCGAPGRVTPTPLVSVPKFPATGNQASVPQVNDSVEPPEVLAFRRCTVTLPGTNTPGVSVPSPSQSPATNRPEGAEKVKVVAAPPSRVFRYDTTRVAGS